jgi:hypothetical protein
VKAGERQTLYRRVIGKYGTQTQTAQTLEELAELAAALSRFTFRGRGSPRDIATEIADVWICLEQMILIHGGRSFRKLILEERERKLQRLHNRIQE